MTDRPKSPELTLFHVTHNEELCRDGKPHDWSGWQEFQTEYGSSGGTSACSKCGMTAISHSLRYGL